MAGEARRQAAHGSEARGSNADASPSCVDVEDVRNVLRHVIDPEVGIDVVDLGLIYGIDVHGESVTVRMTMTSPACPLGEAIEREVVDVVAAVVPRGTDVRVEFVWDPPWDPSRMAESARRRFGWGAP